MGLLGWAWDLLLDSSIRQSPLLFHRSRQTQHCILSHLLLIVEPLAQCRLLSCLWPYAAVCPVPLPDIYHLDDLFRLFAIALVPRILLRSDIYGRDGFRRLLVQQQLLRGYAARDTSSWRLFGDLQLLVLDGLVL